jgi:hypothetical protein
MLSLRVSVHRIGRFRLAREPAGEQLLRQPAQRHDLRAEAAADVRGDDAHLRRLQSEHSRERRAVLVRRLRAEPDRQLAVLEHRGGRARLERARRHPLADQRAGDGHVAAVEEILRMGGGRLRPRRDVRAGVREDECLVLQRLLGIDDHRQRVVVDHHELRCVGARCAVLADDDRDDLADQSHDVLRDDGPPHLLREAEGRRAEQRQVDVGGGEDLDAR